LEEVLAPVDRLRIPGDAGPVLGGEALVERARVVAAEDVPVLPDERQEQLDQCGKRAGLMLEMLQLLHRLLQMGRERGSAPARLHLFDCLLEQLGALGEQRSGAGLENTPRDRLRLDAGEQLVPELAAGFLLAEVPPPVQAHQLNRAIGDERVYATPARLVND